MWGSVAGGGPTGAGGLNYALINGAWQVCCSSTNYPAVLQTAWPAANFSWFNATLPLGGAGAAAGAVANTCTYNGGAVSPSSASCLAQATLATGVTVGAELFTSSRVPSPAPLLGLGGAPQLAATPWAGLGGSVGGMYTIVLTGYFVTSATGVHTLTGWADDTLTVWLGAAAAGPLAGLQTSAATLFATQSGLTLTTTISLTAGIYYPIVIVYTQARCEEFARAGGRARVARERRGHRPRPRDRASAARGTSWRSRCPAARPPRPRPTCSCRRRPRRCSPSPAAWTPRIASLSRRCRARTWSARGR